jgi:hypothetical protein
MTLSIIATRGSSASPTIRQRVRLDGRDYLLDFAWNGRESRWYVDVSDANGTPIVAGRKLVASARVGQRTTDPRRPAGVLCTIDRSGTGVDPGIDELGSRVVLAYMDAAGVAELDAT